MNLIASKALSTFKIGRMGPKISSCMTGSVGFTSVKMVGAINRSSEFVSPPIAMLPDFKKETNRLIETFRDIILID